MTSFGERGYPPGEAREPGRRDRGLLMAPALPPPWALAMARRVCTHRPLAWVYAPMLSPRL